MGRAIASVDQAERPQEPPIFSGFYPVKGTECKYYGVVAVVPEHSEGHFKEDSGFPRILSGHKQIRAAVEAVGMLEKQRNDSKGDVRLAGFEHAVFAKVVVADGNVELLVEP